MQLLLPPILASIQKGEQDIKEIADAASAEIGIPGSVHCKEVMTILAHIEKKHGAPSLLAGPSRSVSDNCRTSEERALCERTIADALLGRQAVAARRSTPPSDEPSENRHLQPKSDADILLDAANGDR